LKQADHHDKDDDPQPDQGQRRCARLIGEFGKGRDQAEKRTRGRDNGKAEAVTLRGCRTQKDSPG
jgi:hypothetical protein